MINMSYAIMLNVSVNGQLLRLLDSDRTQGVLLPVLMSHKPSQISTFHYLDRRRNI